MADLIINSDGDLEFQLLKTAASDDGRSVTEIHDLSTTTEYIQTLIKRAIETPLGHIAVPSLTEQGVTIIDGDYGSRIYRELSEGITLNLLSRLKTHILSSIQAAGLLANIKDVTVGLVDFYTVNITVVFSDNTQSINVTFNLQ